MLGLRKLVLGIVLALALPALGSDLAVLNNGFSIRHDRREQIGQVTRLYTNGNGYVDVPTAMIDHFDKDPAGDVVVKDPASKDAASKDPASKDAASKDAASKDAASKDPARQDQTRRDQSRRDQSRSDQAGTNPQAGQRPPAAGQPPQTPMKLDQVVVTAGASHHLDPDLINSVIRAESGFNIRAVSPKGAQGLMQLMPQTASRLGVSNSFDPRANVEGGTSYLRMLLERYNFDVVKALAAYNAGPQRVAQYRGVPPYHETQLYVARIIRDFNRKKLAEQKAAAVAAKKRSKTAGIETAATAIVTHPASR